MVQDSQCKPTLARPCTTAALENGGVVPVLSAPAGFED